MTEKISLEAVLGALDQLQGHVDEHFFDYSRQWWVAKSVLFPDQFTTRAPVVQDAQEVASSYPVISTFSFEDYLVWYSQFFLREIKRSPELLTLRQRRKEMGLVEQVLKGAAPGDPTIYPLVERSLGTKGRTRTYGGVINRIDAVLPQGGNIIVVAKKVPEQLAKLYEEESRTHEALCQLGYREQVAEPIALGTMNRVITYPHLQGDLASLRERDEQTKKEYVSTALDLLLGMSLDLKRQMAKLSNDPHLQYLAEQLHKQDWTPQYLTLRFIGNFLLRNAAAQMNVEPWDTPFEEFVAVLLGKKKATQISEEARQYPTLVMAVNNPLVHQLHGSYQRTIAPRLAALPRFPGHNDFTIDNILAKSIEEGAEGRLIISGMRLHDIGLVNAPFQSYLFDMLSSCQAAPETRREMIERTYLTLNDACREQGIPFDHSHGQFKEGYRLVSIDKKLKQAALSYLDDQTHHHDHE